MSKKADIIKAATHLFAQKGFKDTSIAEVASLSQVAEGTIFYHFKTKEDLFLAILETVKENILAGFKNHLEDKTFENGLAMIQDVMAAYLYLASEFEDSFRILHRHYPYELARVNPTCRSHLEAIYNCIVDVFEKALVLGQNDGSIDEMPTRKAAMFVFFMVNGLVWFNDRGLYEASSLYNELMLSCRRMLCKHKSNNQEV